MEGKSISFLKEDRRIVREHLLRFQKMSNEERKRLDIFLMHENAWRGLISIIFFIAVELLRVYDIYHHALEKANYVYYWYFGAAFVAVLMLITFLWRFPARRHRRFQRYLFFMDILLVLCLCAQEINSLIMGLSTKENFYCCMIILLAFSIYPKQLRIVLYLIPTASLTIANQLIQGYFGFFYFGIGLLAFFAASLIFNFSCSTELKRVRIEQDNRNLKQVAYIDTLTQIQNRRGIEDYIKVRLRDGIVEGCLYFIDIDNFKAFNDNYGHNVGDEVLRQVANTLHGVALKRGCKVCRYGGEEFLIVMPFPMGKEEAGIIGNEIVTNVSKTEIYNAKSKSVLHVTVSVGCSMFECASLEEMETYIHRADNALYKVKQNGKNGFHIAS